VIQFSKYRISRWLLVVALLLSFGCATSPIGQTDLLDFVKDGVTTREEVFLKLGEPSGTYESLRIITYRLLKDEGGWLVSGQIKGWYGNAVNLVFVFDDRGLLIRHSLVQVRAP
jgi:hypothetical protein